MADSDRMAESDRMADETAQVGRPRNEAASAALKAAALRLVRTEGYGVSVSAIIREAGVSRQTLYNRWPTKAELVLDAFFELAGMQVATPDLGGDTPRRDLLATFLREVFGHLRKDADLLRTLIAEAQTDPGFRAVFFDRFVRPREEIVLALLRDAQARGEMNAGRDPDLASAMIHGAFWYRLLNDRPLTDAVADGLADEVFR